MTHSIANVNDYAWFRLRGRKLWYKNWRVIEVIRNKFQVPCAVVVQRGNRQLEVELNDVVQVFLLPPAEEVTALYDTVKTYPHLMVVRSRRLGLPAYRLICSKCMTPVRVESEIAVRGDLTFHTSRKPTVKPRMAVSSEKVACSCRSRTYNTSYSCT